MSQAATVADRTSTHEPRPQEPTPQARRIRPVPTTHRVLGLSIGQVIAWQLAALAVVATIGTARWIAIGLAVVVVTLTAGRGRGGWWYEQLGRRLRMARHPDLPGLTVRPLSDGQDRALAWDGGAWCVVLAVRSEASLMDIDATDRVFPFSVLSRLVGDGVSAARLVARLPGETTSGGGRAWLTLRGPVGLTHAADAAAILHRRAVRAKRMLAEQALPADLLDEQALCRAQASATGDLTAASATGAPGTATPTSAVHHWTHLEVGDRAEVCLRLSGAPESDTLTGLLRRLAGVPADSVTLAMTVTAPGGPTPHLPHDLGVALDLRLSLGPAHAPLPARTAAERAAAGWRVLRRTGEQAAAYSDTRPVGWFADPAGVPTAFTVRGAGTGWLDVALPRGGVPAGRTTAGEPLTVNLFGLARPRRVGIVGELSAARLLASRALGTGVAVAIRTSRPAAWADLAGTAPAGCLTVTGHDEPVPVHPIRETVLLRDDPEASAYQPDGRAVLDLIPALTARAAATLRGYDLLVLSRSTQIDTLRTSFDVPAQEGRWLARLPGDVLALAVPGRITYSRLEPEPAQPQRERT
jgi:hypothetical protein